MTWKEFAESELGLTIQTTFWDDFSIADRFGVKAVNDTYKRGFVYAKADYKYLTEFIIVLNHKIWQLHGQGRMELAKAYDKLWRLADEYAMENLKGDELTYYINTTD